MANWEYLPHFVYEIKRTGKKTYVHTYEDEAQLIVEKGVVSKRTLRQRYRETAATTKTMMAYLTTVGFDTVFTALTYDPEAATPATDAASVVQVKPAPTTKEVAGAPDLYEFEVRFREV